jgi:hypothetical protein
MKYIILFSVISLSACNFLQSAIMLESPVNCNSFPNFEDYKDCVKRNTNFKNYKNQKDTERARLEREKYEDTQPKPPVSKER